jgi:hypothetical protein
MIKRREPFTYRGSQPLQAVDGASRDLFQIERLVRNRARPG